MRTKMYSVLCDVNAYEHVKSNIEYVCKVDVTWNIMEHVKDRTKMVYKKWQWI